AERHTIRQIDTGQARQAARDDLTGVSAKESRRQLAYESIERLAAHRVLDGVRLVFVTEGSEEQSDRPLHWLDHRADHTASGEVCGEEPRECLDRNLSIESAAPHSATEVVDQQRVHVLRIFHELEHERTPLSEWTARLEQPWRVARAVVELRE